MGEPQAPANPSRRQFIRSALKAGVFGATRAILPPGLTVPDKGVDQEKVLPNKYETRESLHLASGHQFQASRDVYKWDNNGEIVDIKYLPMDPNRNLLQVNGILPSGEPMMFIDVDYSRLLELGAQYIEIGTHDVEYTQYGVIPEGLIGYNGSVSLSRDYFETLAKEVTKETGKAPDKIQIAFVNKGSKVQGKNIFELTSGAVLPNPQLATSHTSVEGVKWNSTPVPFNPLVSTTDGANKQQFRMEKQKLGSTSYFDWVGR